jgi:hypothetical protein
MQFGQSRALEWAIWYFINLKIAFFGNRVLESCPILKQTFWPPHILRLLHKISSAFFVAIDS